ncbi:MAG: cytochrome c biogenesis CcdA family protein [Candidatus Limnocylindrus sp.]
MSEISLLTAILAGALSFLSPCVLPLVPAYLGRMSALRGEESPLLHATLFVGGFTSLFTLLGLGAAYAGGALAGLLPAIQLPLGVAVIVGGLHLAGFVRIPILDRGVAPRAVRAAGRSGSLLLGLAFAAAWTPCIGVVLGSILALAATSTDPVGATALLLSYSAGLGLPFILIAAIATPMRATRSPPSLPAVLVPRRSEERICGVRLPPRPAIAAIRMNGSPSPAL